MTSKSVKPATQVQRGHVEQRCKNLPLHRAGGLELANRVVQTKNVGNSNSMALRFLKLGEQSISPKRCKTRYLAGPGICTVFLRSSLFMVFKACWGMSLGLLSSPACQEDLSLKLASSRHNNSRMAIVMPTT